MRVYLAARFDRQEEMRDYAELFRQSGHEVTSRWLDEPAETPVEEWPDLAEEDLEDVFISEALVAFTEKPSDSYQRGGRHVEFGAALATASHLVAVGPRENLFYYHPSVVVVDTVFEAIDYLNSLEGTERGCFTL